MQPTALCNIIRIIRFELNKKFDKVSQAC